jgi:iron complex outermembrane receptor protein
MPIKFRPSACTLQLPVRSTVTRVPHPDQVFQVRVGITKADESLPRIQQMWVPHISRRILPGDVGTTNIQESLRSSLSGRPGLQPWHQQIPEMKPRGASTSPSFPLFRMTLLLAILSICPRAFAQTPTPVTTTVVVQGTVSDDYLPTQLSAGSLDNLPLQQAPISATVVTRDLLNDQVSRTLTDVIKNDASVGEDYAPVGYYGDYQIRGFTIDLATGLQINGLPIAGEQDVPLENKQQVEILKGIAGIESGITTAGGLFNFVTKRPALIKAIDLATDHRGTGYASTDLGFLLGAQKQFGLRTNLAGEDIHTYVESANGWRGIGTAATDFKLSNNLLWKTDFEYQHKRERSVAGYQLLGGTIVPDIDRLYASNMLADQPWSKPNIFDTFNASSRLDATITPNWHAYLTGSYSHSLIDDNVIYPYGAAYDDAGNQLCPNAPYYFFCPDGSYEAYDYRSPAELRIDTIGEAVALGHLKTGPITHDLVLGGAMFYRAVDLSPTIIYAPIGVENIYQPNIIFPEQTYVPAGPSTQADFNHQSSALVQDRITLPGRIRLTAGGRFASLTDYNFTPGQSKSIWLPQYSATFAPIANLTLYGSYSVLLSLGPQAPFWVDNSSVYLAPFLTRQAEVGAKFEPSQRILLSTALFHMRAPFFYPRVIQAADSFCTGNPTPVNPGDVCFESDGHETHNGIEFNAQGKAANWLRLTASAAAIAAKSDDSQTEAFNNRQVINAPKFKTALFADISLPTFAHLQNLHLQPGWSYTDRKQATRDDQVSVGGYNLFNLGASYQPAGEQGHITFHLYADNILDKHYWKDTGASYGDTFIHLGAPTTVRLSSQYRF